MYSLDQHTRIYVSPEGLPSKGLPLYNPALVVPSCGSFRQLKGHVNSVQCGLKTQTGLVPSTSKHHIMGSCGNFWRPFGGLIYCKLYSI